MQLDITDIKTATDELIKLMIRYQLEGNLEINKPPLVVMHSGTLNLRNLLESTWVEELKTIFTRDVLQLYHVCYQKYETKILTHGIYHDTSPTLTASLIGAIGRAEAYHGMGGATSILKANVPIDYLEFRFIDDMGPGFLPTAQKTRQQILPDALPIGLVKQIFDERHLPSARWLNPKYFEGTVYRPNADTRQHILDEIRTAQSSYLKNLK